MICKYCGEEYTFEELQELRKMGEHFIFKEDMIICPDCYDRIQRSTLEEQFIAFMQED